MGAFLVHEVGVHGADHVFRQDEVEAFAYSGHFDHGHADGVAADVAGAVAAVEYRFHAGVAGFLGGVAGLHVLLGKLMELLVGRHHLPGNIVHALRKHGTGELDPVAALTGDLQAVHHAVAVLYRTVGGEHHLRFQGAVQSHLDHVHGVPGATSRGKGILRDTHQFRFRFARLVGADHVKHPLLVYLHGMPD